MPLCKHCWQNVILVIKIFVMWTEKGKVQRRGRTQKKKDTGRKNEFNESIASPAAVLTHLNAQPDTHHEEMRPPTAENVQSTGLSDWIRAQLADLPCESQRAKFADTWCADVCHSQQKLRITQLTPQPIFQPLWWRHYNMTVWILARKEINFSMAAGLIRLHMPGVK